MLGNAAIPLLGALSQLALCLFPLVLVFEAWVAHRRLRLSWWDSLEQLIVANIASYVAGLAVLIPVSRGMGPFASLPSDLFWFFPGYRVSHVVGLAVVLGVFCWISLWVEERILRLFWKSIPPEQIRSSTRWSHLPVYGLWFVVGAAILISVPRSPY
ncbi:MAG: hypothetical protein JSR82_20635 [Verrucomicrobia bacterium]|nr:hypothetical protein [Verrucomicrobiota bacterium]